MPRPSAAAEAGRGQIAAATASQQRRSHRWRHKGSANYAAPPMVAHGSKGRVGEGFEGSGARVGGDAGNGGAHKEEQ